MRSIRIHLVSLPAEARAAASAAARAAFPDAEIVESTALRDVLQRAGATGLELLVLSDSDSHAVSQIVEAEKSPGQPRCAVVLLGRTASELVETVPPEEWQPELLARVFRSAVLQHELICENLRLRGDLKTIARRFSHDLVTPVGCINTSACVLKILPPEETQSIAAIIQNIEDSSAEISQLTERISFVIKASADPGVPVEVEMGEVVSEVLEQLEADIKKAGATVDVPASWPDVAGISKCVHVIWCNLVGNALKHGGPSARIQLAWRADGENYWFSVSDRGAGVAPVVKPGLFRPFDQLHAVQTAGLGLSIVQRLLTLQGGQGRYEDRPDGGAHFSFSLPALIN